MDLRIREAVRTDACPIARVQVGAWRSTLVGIVPDDYLAGLSYGEQVAHWDAVLTTDRPSNCNFVAETVCREVVGFATAGPTRGASQIHRGELYTVYLLNDYRRFGAGRRLLNSVAQRLHRTGIASMLTWVLKDNRPARQFYEALGTEYVGQQPIEIGGKSPSAVSYGWSNITELMDRRLV